MSSLTRVSLTLRFLVKVASFCPAPCKILYGTVHKAAVRRVAVPRPRRPDASLLEDVSFCPAPCKILYGTVLRTLKFVSCNTIVESYRSVRHLSPLAAYPNLLYHALQSPWHACAMLFWISARTWLGRGRAASPLGDPPLQRWTAEP